METKEAPPKKKKYFPCQKMSKKFCTGCGKPLFDQRHLTCKTCYWAIVNPNYVSDEGPIDEPAEPTETLPGSLERIDVLGKRMEQKVKLWHPDDSVLPGLSEECIQKLLRLYTRLHPNDHSEPTEPVESPEIGEEEWTLYDDDWES